MFTLKRIKILWPAFAASISFAYTTPTFAADPPAKCTGVNECSELIYLTSLEILKSVNRLPELVEAWISEDNSEKSFTPKLQENFTQYIGYTIQNDDQQVALQKGLMQAYFAEKTPSYVNQLTFTTLLNQPFSNTQEKDADGKAVNSAYNYIKNASGLNITHILPSTAWRGSDEAKQKYYEYYKTISSVQSFNTYILSSLYADSQNDMNLSKKQKELLEQASDSKWFVSVASENIGVVLRQVLLFNSQMYVLMLKLLDIQKQQLAAQSLTNTLLIIGNQYTERDLYETATGNAPSAANATSL